MRIRGRAIPARRAVGLIVYFVHAFLTPFFNKGVAIRDSGVGTMC